MYDSNSVLFDPNTHDLPRSYLLSMDKSWIEKPRTHLAYLEGVENFIKIAKEKALIDGKIVCPYRTCYNRFYYEPIVVEDHLVWNGFVYDYTTWIFHGESLSSIPTNVLNTQHTFDVVNTSNMQQGIVGCGEIREMLTDAFPCGSHSRDELLDNDIDDTHPNEDNGNISDDDNQVDDLMKECDKPLFPGCQNFSSLSFILNLYHLKVLNGWSGKSFSMFLDLLSEAFPEGISLP